MKISGRIIKNSGYILKKKGVLLRLLDNYFQIIAKKRIRLRTVELALTYACQCSCEYCSAKPFMKKTKEDFKKKCKENLTLAEWKHLIDECCKEGALHFLLTGGEVLLYDDLFLLIEYISKNKGSLVSLVTNGYLLSEKTVKRLKQAGLDMIEISLDYPNQKKHDDFRKLNGCYSNAINGIRHCKKYGITPMINTVITRENINDGSCREMIKLAKNRGVDLNFGFASMAGEWLNKEDALLKEGEYKKALNLLENNNVRWCGDTAYIKRGCSAGSEKIYVTSYGDIMPCPLVQVAFGNIREKSLGQILRRMREDPLFREVHKRCMPSYNKDYINRYIKSDKRFNNQIKNLR